MGAHQSFLILFHKQCSTFSNCKVFLLNWTIFGEITIKIIKEPCQWESRGLWTASVFGTTSTFVRRNSHVRCLGMSHWRCLSPLSPLFTHYSVCWSTTVPIQSTHQVPFLWIIYHHHLRTGHTACCEISKWSATLLSLGWPSTDPVAQSQSTSKVRHGMTTSLGHTLVL